MTTPMRLSLAITADASGVAPATAEVRREIGGLEADAHAATQALSAHSAANDQVAAASRRAAEAVRGQGAAERDLRDAVMRFAGVRPALNDNEFRQRGADIAAYGKGLDELRAKFNPVFTVIQSYKATQAEIRQAHAVGAISIDEMAAALGRERQAALASIAALKGRSSALASTGGGGGSFNTANIAAQFQDIAVTSAMGMSPLQIALQQGTQLSAVFEQMKASGQSAGAGLLAAFSSIISPISLATIGVVGLTTAAVQYFTTSSKGTETLDEILSRHEENIQRLGPAYEAARKKANEYATDPSVVNALLRDDVKKAEAKLKEEIGKTLRAIEAELVEFAARNNGSLLGNRLAPAQDLIQSLRDGKIEIGEFLKQATELENAGKLSPAAATALRGYGQAADEVARALAGMTPNVSEVDVAFGNLSKAIENVKTDSARSELEALMKRAREGLASVGDVETALHNLSGTSPDLSAAAGSIFDLFKKAVAAKAAIDALSGPIGGETVAGGKTHRAGAMDQLQEEYDQALAMAKRLGIVNEQIGDVDLTPKQAKGANAYRDILKSADDRIAQIRQEIDLLGHAGAEVEALRYVQELLSRATDKGRSLDEEQIAAIKAKAAEYGRLRAELSATKLEQDLLFEREQLFRSPTEQRVHSTLRSAGIDPASERGQYLAEQIRVNEQLALGRDLAMDFGSSLAEAFADGKLEAEELLDIVMNLIQQLLSNPGALSGVGSFVSSIFGGGFNPSPTGFRDMIGYAKGGAFAGSNVVPFRKGGTFTNSVVDRPTLFSFANGSKFGEMGEAGPEAIMPLKRDSQGRLGVIASQAANQNGSTSTVRLIMPEGWRAEIVAEARQGAQSDTIQIVQENNAAQENRYQNGAPR